MWVQSLGWKDSLEEGMAMHFSLLAGAFHGLRSLAGYRPQRHKESDTNEATQHTLTCDPITFSELFGVYFL